MLIISVIVIAVTAAAYMFVPVFQDGVMDLASDVSTILDSGKIGAVGVDRGGGTGGMGSGSTNTAGMIRICGDDDPRWAAMYDPPACVAN
jgi:hypothetical protein